MLCACSEEDLPVVATRFAHSANLNTLYARLGLFYDDVTPTAENFDEQQTRKFRMSRIGTMASNIAFVLYECSAAEQEDVVQVLVNEQPVVLPGACKTDLIEFVNCITMPLHVRFGRYMIKE